MTTVDIVAMPVAEKLRLMEVLWDSLCTQASASEQVGVPAWHGAVLEERLRRLAGGAEATSPWKEAKDRIRSQIKAG